MVENDVEFSNKFEVLDKNVAGDLFSADNNTVSIFTGCFDKNGSTRNGAKNMKILSY